MDNMSGMYAVDTRCAMSNAASVECSKNCSGPHGDAFSDPPSDRMAQMDRTLGDLADLALRGASVEDCATVTRKRGFKTIASSHSRW